MDFLALQLLGGELGGQRSWLEAVFLGCLFWVALARPERIRNLLQFRLACLLFAVALIAPTVINLYLFRDNLNPTARISAPGRPQDPGFGVYLYAVTPLLLLLSFILAIDSVTPWRRSELPPPRE